MSSRTPALENKTFGMLTVVKRDGRNNSGVKWLCKCKCGNEVRMITSELTSCNRTHCGCENRTKTICLTDESYVLTSTHRLNIDWLTKSLRSLKANVNPSYCH